MASTRIIAVGGARDGVGKTVFTVNAALSLLKETRARVLVLDLDQESCGDVLQLLGMQKAKSLADFAPYVDKLKPAQLRQYISAQTPDQPWHFAAYLKQCTFVLGSAMVDGGCQHL